MKRCFLLVVALSLVITSFTTVQNTYAGGFGDLLKGMGNAMLKGVGRNLQKDFAQKLPGKTFEGFYSEDSGKKGIALLTFSDQDGVLYGQITLGTQDLGSTPVKFSDEAISVAMTLTFTDQSGRYTFNLDLGNNPPQGVVILVGTYTGDGVNGSSSGQIKVSWSNSGK